VIFWSRDIKSRKVTRKTAVRGRKTKGRKQRAEDRGYNSLRDSGIEALRNTEETGKHGFAGS
jgi:hypothetical protein